jgi:hypothetical protein
VSIRFPGPWGALHQPDMRRLARMPESGPAHVRLFYLALATANRIGHAEFYQGQLRDFLGGEDRLTGEIRPSARSTVSDGIRQAIEIGTLHRDSCSRCLVLPQSLWQKNGRGTMSCRVHDVRLNDITATPRPSV